jgi:hypothetical protein
MTEPRSYNGKGTWLRLHDQPRPKPANWDPKPRPSAPIVTPAAKQDDASTFVTAVVVIVALFLVAAVVAFNPRSGRAIEWAVERANPANRVSDDFRPLALACLRWDATKQDRDEYLRQARLVVHSAREQAILDYLSNANAAAALDDQYVVDQWRRAAAKLLDVTYPYTGAVR